MIETYPARQQVALPDGTDNVRTRHELTRISISPSDAARFWAKVDRRGPNECWVWQGATLKGYGRVGLSKRTVLAHRFAWVLAHGAISTGMDVLHRCDNPPCCNVTHLFLGTHQDNMADRDAKGRTRAALGEQNGRAKLTDADVSAIRAAYQRGVTPQREIATQYGVDQTTISAIVLRQARTGVLGTRAVPQRSRRAELSGRLSGFTPQQWAGTSGNPEHLQTGDEARIPVPAHCAPAKKETK